MWWRQGYTHRIPYLDKNSCGISRISLFSWGLNRKGSMYGYTYNHNLFGSEWPCSISVHQWGCGGCRHLCYNCSDGRHFHNLHSGPSFKLFCSYYNIFILFMDIFLYPSLSFIWISLSCFLGWNHQAPGWLVEHQQGWGWAESTLGGTNGFRHRGETLSLG